MTEIKIRDIEEFIYTIEDRIESLEVGIDTVRKYGTRLGDIRFVKAMLIKQKQEMEDDLLRFRNMDATELIKTKFAGFDRLIACKEMIIEE